MAAGLQVFNANGTLQFDTTNRLFRTLASVQSGVANGSVAIPSNPGGTVVAVVSPNSTDGKAPNITVSGSSVSWNFATGAGARSNSTISVVAY